MIFKKLPVFLVGFVREIKTRCIILHIIMCNVLYIIVLYIILYIYLVSLTNPTTCHLYSEPALLILNNNFMR